MNIKGVPIRHGDVYLVPIDTPDMTGFKQVVDENRKHETVLAYGEVTGHAHVVPASQADLYERQSDGYRVLLAKAFGDTDLDPDTAVPIVTHEEHRGVPLVPGQAYKVVYQVEYTPQELRRVID